MEAADYERTSAGVLFPIIASPSSVDDEVDMTRMGRTQPKSSVKSRVENAKNSLRGENQITFFSPQFFMISDPQELGEKKRVHDL